MTTTKRTPPESYKQAAAYWAQDRALDFAFWLAGYRWELAPVLAALVALVFASEQLPMFAAVPLSLLAAGFPAWRWWNRRAWELHNHARRARRFARRFPDLCEKLNLTRTYTNRAGLPQMEVPSVRSWVLLPGGGFRLHLRCPIGVTPSDFERESEALAGALGGSSIQVKRNPRHAGDVYLTLVGEDDPLYGEPKPPAELLALPGGHSPMDGVAIGYNSVEETIRVNLYQNSFLIGGSPGSGKSVLMQQFAAFCALAEHCELWCIDPKLVELQTFWADSAHRMATDVESASALLDELIEVMNARYAKLQSQRLQKVFDEREGRMPTADMPLIVLIVDEVAELTASLDKKKGAEFAERLRLLVAKSRASGIVICLCSQKPDTSVIPSSIRDLCSITICLRTGTEAQAITVMGSAAVKEGGATAHLIGTDTPGLAYLAGDEGGEVSRFRSFYVNSAGMETLSARAAAYRLGELPAGAKGSEANPPPPGELTAEPADLVTCDPGSILPPKAEDPAPFPPRDYLADTTPPKVVFGCDEHRGKWGADALQTAHACPSCMELPGGDDGH